MLYGSWRSDPLCPASVGGQTRCWEDLKAHVGAGIPAGGEYSPWEGAEVQPLLSEQPQPHTQLMLKENRGILQEWLCCISLLLWGQNWAQSLIPGHWLLPGICSPLLDWAVWQTVAHSGLGHWDSQLENAFRMHWTEIWNSRRNTVTVGTDKDTWVFIQNIHSLFFTAHILMVF